MPSIYRVTDYSATLPAEFKQEDECLQSLLGDELVAVHQIGSTSVPRLTAKPIIDLLPEIRNTARNVGFTPMLQNVGYKAWGEYGLPGRRSFTKDRRARRTLNVHMYQVSHIEIEPIYGQPWADSIRKAAARREAAKSRRVSE